MKDKNTVIGILLITVILIGYYFLNLPSSEEQKHNLPNSSVDTTKEEELSNSQKHIISESAEVAQTIPKIELKKDFVYENEFEQKLEKIYYIESNLLKIGISNIGGKIVYLELKNFLRWDKKHLVLVNKTFHRFGLVLFIRNKPVLTDFVYFEPVIQNQDSILLLPDNSNDTLFLALRFYPIKNNSLSDSSAYIEYLYGLVNNSYVVHFKMSLHNLENLLPPTTSYLNFDMAADIFQKEKSYQNELNQTTIYYSYTDGEVDYISESKTQYKESIALKLKWLSFKQQFFSMAIIASDAFDGAELEVSKNDNHDSTTYLKTLFASLIIPIKKDNRIELPLMFYFGPNKYKVLNSLELNLERQIPLGWSFFLLHWINRFVVLPIFNYLENFNLNYGIIILIMTIIIKIILFPISYKTYLSTARMKILKPEIEEINKKFSKKEDTIKRQQATMDLYRRAGVNPMSGCLPLLLQLPILIAMFRFFPASIELRQKAFLWAEDLSSYDSILDLGFEIPFYGSHVSLFTLLMTISTLIYTHINSKMMSTGSQQLPGMKTMMYLMPILFLGFFNSFSCALSYYYLLTNLFTFLQMGIFQKVINEEKLRIQIEENKKKPRKLSWQERLEKMARERQQQTQKLKKKK